MSLLAINIFVSKRKSFIFRSTISKVSCLFRYSGVLLLTILFSVILSASKISAQSNSRGKMYSYKMGSIQYALIRIPENYQMNLKVPVPFMLSSISANIRCGGLAMTGTYTARETGAVEGLIVINGEVVSKKSHRTDGGVLIFDGALTSIARIRDRFSWSAGQSVDVIQSHPILILDGKIDLPLDDQRKANRVALGKLEDGQLFMVMAYDNDRQALSAVTLLQFAEDVDRIMEDRVAWLMNFDGGPSAFIYAGKATLAPSPGRVTSYICAEPAK